MNCQSFSYAFCLFLGTMLVTPPMGDPNPQRDPRQDRQQPKWSPQADRQLRQWLEEPKLSEAQEHALGDLLADFNDEDQVEQRVATALTNPRISRALRLQLLQALGDPRIESLPRSWLNALGKALGASDLLVCREGIATVKRRDLSQFDQRLKALSLRSDVPVELRLAALDCVAARQRLLSPEPFAFLTEHLSEQTGPLERLLAARALGATSLDGEHLRQLAGQLTRTDPTVGLLLLPSFLRSREEAVGLALVQALNHAPAVELMTLGDLDRLLIVYPNSVRVAAKSLRDRLAAPQEKDRRDLARLTTQLPPGNGQRGEKVFFAEHVACSRCHRAADKGGGVGPNLSRIGFLRGREELLESIVLPSAYVAPEFRAYIVVTRDGRTVTGLIARETAEAIYLRTGTAADTRVARKEVEESFLSKVSLMPEGFEKVMSRQELSDLLAFLVNLR